jgi:hypothetical protein
MKTLPTFDEAMNWLLARHGSNYKVAKYLGMTPQNLFRVRGAEETRVLRRTKEWIRFKAMEAGCSEK